ncbi:sodium-dependent transporter [Rhodothermaceae bacterium RA]|nr:sodium-dependent transporter [Rhodothermaceae bacterium RA]
MAQHADQRFSSRLGLILSVLGIAVGTGNIWRFPRIAAQNGGDEGAGAFLIAWVLFLFLWSIPLIIAEYALGRKGRMGVVGTFARVAGPRYAWMGGFVGFVSTAIMFYYSVVAGWCVFYFVEMLVNPLPLTTEAATGVWDGFQAGGLPVLFHGLAMGLGALAVWKGVASIERVNKVLIPALLLIVLLCVLRAVTLDGAAAGLAFLFTPQWDLLTRPGLWLEALTQNAWDTGAGWGLILTYGAYMQRRHGVVKNAFLTGLGNNTVSLLAAVMIFGTVFAVLGQQMPKAEVLAVMQNSGPASTGLTFIWMPQLFAKMPAGEMLAVLFFLGLSFAAFSSLISMIELATRVFVDMGLPRRRAVAAVCTVGFLLGVPSAVNLDVFGNQDFVWGVALMISGALVAFAVIRYGVERFRQEELLGTPGDWSAGPAWGFLIRYLVPLQAAVLLVWWLYQSATRYAPETWYDPFDPYSVMTCLVQWGLVMGLLIAFNRRLVRRTLPEAAAP